MSSPVYTNYTTIENLERWLENFKNTTNFQEITNLQIHPSSLVKSVKEQNNKILTILEETLLHARKNLPKGMPHPECDNIETFYNDMDAMIQNTRNSREILEQGVKI